jgi:intracellular sulfur oxidation DsrE/DsrF family protein
MFKFASRLGAAVLALTMLFGAAQAQAAGTKKVVLQLSDGSPDKQTLVLNVANNLLKAFDDIEVEVVAFGPGLRMLFADNANAGRVQSLAASGVKFGACSNTMRKMTKILGEEPKLNPNAVMVGAGIGRILELVDQGYVLVRP